MTPDRWRLVTEVFHAARARDGAARAAYLADVCDSDADLRAQVEALLAAHDEAGSFGATATIAREPLAPGTTLGPYRIEALIGAGGMGEVYRATDTRLGRVVAIKILPPHLRASPDLQARFEREARAISQLTHPNICTLYDVGHENGVDFLVMEHLDGQTLAARLERGALPRDQALQIGAEIASALDHAHRRGIVHRDLKPSNVMLTKTGAKLLDFGIAKLQLPASAEPRHMTSGVLLGTIQYMAPEVLEGHEADARSDIWSLGCVLFEMMTGQQACDAAADAEVIAPRTLDHIVRACLAKAPDERWQSASDVARELQWIGASTPEKDVSRPRTSRAWWAAAVVVATAAALLPWYRFGSHARNEARSRFTVSLAAAGLTLTDGGLAVSPDGRSLVFGASAADGESRLYLRRLDEWDPRPLKGTTGALAPTFSPDGEWVAFFANGALQKLRLPDGTPQSVCAIDYGWKSRPSWGMDGRIVLDSLNGVSDRGGTPQPISPNINRREYRCPQHVGTGDSWIVSVAADSGPQVLVLNSRSGSARPLVQGMCGRYLPTGHLLYESDGHLRAVAFDANRFEIRGTSSVVVDDLVAGTMPGFSSVGYDVSSSGTIAYLSATAFDTRLVWKDRAGRSQPLPLLPRRYTQPSLSSDGNYVAVTVKEWGAQAVWFGSVQHEPLTRINGPGSTCCGVFSRDGRWLLLSSLQNGHLFRLRLDGKEEVAPVTRAGGPQKGTSWSPDGQIVLLNEFRAKEKRDILEADVRVGGAIRPFLSTTGDELEGVFSADGKWVAYQSDQSGAGKWEVYVRPFPGNGAPIQVSSGGGTGPMWNPRGGEIFYQGHDALMAVRMSGGVPSGAPTELFPCSPTADFRREFDVAPDGQHFLCMEPANPRGEISVITNWFEELKVRVPVR